MTRSLFVFRLLLAATAGGLWLAVSELAVAQTSIPAPQREILFRQDSGSAQRTKEKDLKAAIARDSATGKEEMDLRAPQIEYSKDGKSIKAAGGVTLQSGSMAIESDNITVQTENKDATLQGSVTVSNPEAKIQASSGVTNLDSEAGSFSCAKVRFEDSNYQAQAGELRKLDDERFELDDVSFTTCGCGEGSGVGPAAGADGSSCAKSSVPPWSIEASSLTVTRDGYAYGKGATLNVDGIPIFYAPYFGFPVREERQSGLLAPTFGYSSEDGFKSEIPLFITLGETADVTLTPFLQTKTRTGLSVGYRQKYSRLHQLESRFYYSDENARGDSLRGTNVEGLSDPTFDEQRTALYSQHYWRAESDAALDLTYISDIHYVSDDLFLREIPDNDLGDSTDTSTISRALVRAGLGEYGIAELSGEYVQALDQQDDDLVFKRLPELNVNVSKAWRPFGYNDYGLKIVSALDYLADDFYRKDGYDGLRSHAVPSLTVPFHIGPFVQGYTGISMLQTNYNLNSTFVPGSEDGTGTDLESSNSRTLPVISAGLSTAVDRVFDIEKDSWLASVTSMGANNQEDNLVRVRHSIEPYTRFTGIPDRDQEDLPTFDSIDRISEKRSLAYGVRTSLYGKFAPTSSLPERNRDLIGSSPILPGSQALTSDREQEDLGRVAGGARVDGGNSREIITFIAKQNFDILEYNRDEDPDNNGLSDIDTGVYLFPTPQFALGLESSVDAEDGKFASWSVMTDLASDRGDSLRAQWNFVRDSISGESLISQFEGNAEVVLTNRLRAGVYSRLDELENSSLESRAAFRFFGKCRCWHIDLGYGQRANPNRNELLLSFTLQGLGDIAQPVRVDNESGSE